MQGDREYTLYMRAGEEHYVCDMYQELSCIDDIGIIIILCI